jgi:MurNAc alpha-1-phosphate uridylyltransferase
MILAAGRGERLRPITDEIPKALVEIHGKSLLERQLESVQRAGIETVVINLGWLGEQIVERVGSGERFGLTVVYSPEGDNVLETGGGIQRALPMLGDAPFVVANADVFTDMALPLEISNDHDAHLVLVPNPPYRERGDFDLVDGQAMRSESPAFTFSGVAIYRPSFFAGCEAGRFPLAPLLFAAADEGRLGAERYDGTWQDVGTPERLAKLNQI